MDGSSRRAGPIVIDRTMTPSDPLLWKEQDAPILPGQIIKIPQGECPLWLKRISHLPSRGIVLRVEELVALRRVRDGVEQQSLFQRISLHQVDDAACAGTISKLLVDAAQAGKSISLACDEPASSLSWAQRFAYLFGVVIEQGWVVAGSAVMAQTNYRLRLHSAVRGLTERPRRVEQIEPMPPTIQIAVNGLRIPLPSLPQRNPGIFIFWPEDPMQDRQQQAMKRRRSQAAIRPRWPAIGVPL